jgi:hypothetical protein
MKKCGINEFRRLLQYSKKTILIMKLSVIITLIFTLQASASVHSQGKISIELMESSLEEIISEIKNQSDFQFLYNNEETKEVRNLDISVKDATVEEILDIVLKDFNLDYKVVNAVVVITPAPGKVKKEIKKITPPKQEKVKFKGKVTDEDGNPLPYAAVVIKGTRIGAAADSYGNFEIVTEEGDYEYLVVQSLGYVLQEIKIEGQLFYEITLAADSSGIEEVVITGYQTLSKERATGSFVTVSKEVLEQVKSMSILDRLESVTSGINIVRDGTTGKLTPIIRGISSLQGNMNAPLFVVDGCVSCVSTG